jgi:hypothetical protein
MSFEDILTYDGYQHKTFQMSAVAHGYVNDETEALVAFQGIANLSTPAELRAQLVMMTVQGYPTLCILEKEDLYELMYADYLHHDNECSGNVGLAKNKCLLDLQRRFQEHGEDIMEACGFPLPTAANQISELDRLRMKYDPEQQRDLLHSYLEEKPNTEEQERLFNRIKYALENKQQLLIFIQGTAGTGKTTFAKKLTALTRSMGMVALGCAATALAAQIYGEEEEFCTAHQLFGIPVVEDGEDIDHEADITSKYINQSAKLEVIKAARLVMWDEGLTNHKQCLSTAFSVSENFQNMVLVIMGDWQQCPPVVRNGDMEEIVTASMMNSRYWNDFEVVHFTINLRLLAAGPQTFTTTSASTSTAEQEFISHQKKYLEMLDIIGSGRKPPPLADTVVEMYDENIEIDGSRVVALPLLKCINETSAALDFLFPGGFDVDLMHTRAILCATNVQGDEWNSIIQNLNSNPTHILPSVDTV